MLMANDLISARKQLAVGATIKRHAHEIHDLPHLVPELHSWNDEFSLCTEGATTLATTKHAEAC